MVTELPPKLEAPILKGSLFVTGGSNGIGQEILTRLSPKYPVFFNYDANEGKDVRDYSSIVTALDKTLSKTQQNDLVLSAGVFRPIDFLHQTPQDIDFVLDTNLKGTMYVIQSFLKWREENSNQIRPNIVIISSISAFFHGGRTNVVYDATKSAMSYMVKDLANYNCIVNAVEPGTVRDTEIGAWTPDFQIDKTNKQIVDKGQKSDVETSGIEVTKRDVADVVEMLLFNNAHGAINGTTIAVDGGLTSLKQRF